MDLAASVVAAISTIAWSSPVVHLDQIGWRNERRYESAWTVSNTEGVALRMNFETLVPGTWGRPPKVNSGCGKLKLQKITVTDSI